LAISKACVIVSMSLFPGTTITAYQLFPRQIFFD
jgi:hypothetical protein